MPRIGDVYGCLTVTKPNSYQDKHGSRYSECLCECGNTLKVLNHVLLGSGKQETRTSCGRQHKLSNTLTYKSWVAMKRRCQDHQHVAYQSYGGRGIKVCQRWNNSFLTFLTDMGERPGKDYSLDSINNDGDYEPGNCRWATRLEQGNNTRKNRLITYQGKTQTLALWSEELGIHYGALHSRIKRGWTLEKAFTK